jgi:membrane-bound lytic murein transglycosylase D
MNKKFAVLMLCVIVMGGLLAACERQAPVAQSVPTETVGIPFPVGDKPTVPVSQMGTQTAVARTPGVIAPTLEPAQATPQPQDTQAPQAQPTEPPAVVTATPKPVVVVVKTPARPQYYTVQPGDTYYCIARRYDLNVTEFLGINALGNEQATIGKTVRIPESGNWDSGSRSLHAHPDTYTVDSGDTLYKIACYYGDVYPEVILQVNGLKNENDVKPGMKLNIP